jgi:hypothetical protein
MAVQFEEVQRLAESIVSVEVEAMNEAGDNHYAFGTAPSVDQAVRDASAGGPRPYRRRLVLHERMVGNALGVRTSQRLSSIHG